MNAWWTCWTIHVCPLTYVRCDSDNTNVGILAQESRVETREGSFRVARTRASSLFRGHFRAIFNVHYFRAPWPVDIFSGPTWKILRGVSERCVIFEYATLSWRGKRRGSPAKRFGCDPQRGYHSRDGTGRYHLLARACQPCVLLDLLSCGRSRAWLLRCSCGEPSTRVEADDRRSWVVRPLPAAAAPRAPAAALAPAPAVLDRHRLDHRTWCARVFATAWVRCVMPSSWNRKSDENMRKTPNSFLKRSRK